MLYVVILVAVHQLLCVVLNADMWTQCMYTVHVCLG